MDAKTDRCPVLRSNGEQGKHHQQAICTCATHLLDRVMVVLCDNRPYEFRDLDGTLLTKSEAVRIVQQRYRVAEEVRQRNNKRARRPKNENLKEKRIEGKLRK